MSYEFQVTCSNPRVFPHRQLAGNNIDQSDAKKLQAKDNVGLAVKIADQINIIADKKGFQIRLKQGEKRVKKTHNDRNSKNCINHPGKEVRCLNKPTAGAHQSHNHYFPAMSIYSDPDRVVNHQNGNKNKNTRK